MEQNKKDNVGACWFLVGVWMGVSDEIVQTAKQTGAEIASRLLRKDVSGAKVAENDNWLPPG